MYLNVKRNETFYRKDMFIWHQNFFKVFIRRTERYLCLMSIYYMSSITTVDHIIKFQITVNKYILN